MSSPNLSRAIEGFILFKLASGRSSNTIRNYKTELKRFLHFTEDCDIQTIKSNQIESYFIYLSQEFRITKCGTTSIPPRRISKKTLSNAHGTLAVFWLWASSEYEFNNPFKVSPIKYHIKPISPFREDEIEKLLAQCKTNTKNLTDSKSYTSRRNTYKRDKSIILTLLDTGMRVSELCNIRMKDLDLENGKVFITGKGNKSRYVFLGKVSRQSIWTYLSERFPKEPPFPEEPLFTERYGINPLSRQAILLLLKRLGKKASISNVHPHKFRHTFAIEFLRNGGNVFELQQLLGHSDLATAKKYVYLAQSDLETSIRKASPVDRWQLRV